MSATLTLVMLVAFGGAEPLPGDSGEFALFVGRSVCLQCHSSPDANGGAASVCTLEPIPLHDHSYEALQKPTAEHIAALSGVPDVPTQSRICLYCHATAADEGPRWTTDAFRTADGVQCEACHGPGSLHVRSAAGSEYANRSRAVPGNALIQRGDRQSCERCHVDRPSHKEVLERGFRLSEVDRLYKTPANLVVSPDGTRLFVVCEHGNSVIAVDLATGTVLGEVAVGRRPHDVACSPDGNTLYVSNRMDATMSVVDAKQLKVTATIAVGFEPHGVAVDPTGRHVYVANTADDTLAIVDVDRLTVSRKLVMGGGPWSLAFDSTGRYGYVTNIRPRPVPFRDPPKSEVTIVDAELGVVSARANVADANMLQGVAPVPGRNVALVTLMRTKNLVPVTRIAQGWVITNGLGVLWPDGRVDQVLLDEPADSFPDPTDVAVTPDGRRALVTSGGADEVALVDVEKLLETIQGFTEQQRAEILPNHLGMSGRFVVKRIAVGANPRGVAIARDGKWAYVTNALDDSVTVIDMDRGRADGVISLGGPTELSELRRGERLFHSAEGTSGRQFSCRSCHPDGHDSGLTFDIESDGIGLSPVDNRSLRGIFDTLPFKWEGTNPSLRRQCGPRFTVFFTRLEPFPPEQLDAMARYMGTIEQPPNRHRRAEGLTLAQRRGKAVFERALPNDGSPLSPQRQCSFCHSGAYLTDQGKFAVSTTMWFDAFVPDVDLRDDLFNADEFGELGTYLFIDAGMPAKILDTPHLRNIVDSPPYLHNGGAATLEEIWTRFNMTDRHGPAHDLTRQQLNDLIAYLKSL
ncbi:MAG: beta-propeller fold lactonase family protein [Planctomycetota bacterium]